MKWTLALAICAFLFVSRTSYAAEWKYPPSPQDHAELLEKERPGQDRALREKMARELESNMQSGSAKALEAAWSNALAKKSMSPNGLPYIAVFHVALHDAMDSLGPKENGWELIKQAVDSWQKAYPKSLGAELAQTQLMLVYAWKIRGGGYSNTVP